MPDKKVLSNVFPMEGVIYEVILSLYRWEENERVPNSSVMGVRRRGVLLFSTLFEGSDSFRIVDKGVWVGISVPHYSEGLWMYVRAALSGYGCCEREFSDEDYDEMGLEGKEKVLVLKGCMASIVARAERVTERIIHDELGECRVKEVTWRVMDIQAIQGYQSAYSRFIGMIFEALVEGSRYLSTRNNRCLQKTENYLAIAERLATKMQLEIIEEIREKLYSSSSKLE